MIKELQRWVELKHKNVLPLLGYTTDGGLYYLSLITEWMVDGTALQYIKAKRTSGKKVDILRMVSWILIYLINN